MKLRIAYLCTTFPVKSELFLQREIRAMKHLPVDVSLFSLWGGKPTFEGLPVQRFPKWKLLLLPFYLLKELIRNPEPFGKGLKSLLKTRPTSLLNSAENLLGAAFAILFTSKFRAHAFDLMHATWASMPATAAIVISKLTDIPYSMASSAYDIFHHNGDMFLDKKAHHAVFLHVESFLAKERLVQANASPHKIALIRRGISPLPPFQSKPSLAGSLKIITIGRFVEKKGLLRQIEIYAALKEKGISFAAKIIGDGSLKRALEKRIAHFDLSNAVQLVPWLPYPELEKQYRWADVFLFTGKVAKSGDRDGLPNVILEAMALGLPIITSNVAALPEVIINHETGCIINDYANDAAWTQAFTQLIENPGLYHRVQKNARAWIEENADANKNGKTMIKYFSEAVMS